MFNKVMLLSGRPGSGKSEMLMAYLNAHPKTSILVNLEKDAQELYATGLDENIKVVNQDNIDFTELLKYETIGIDYIQLFDKTILDELVSILIKYDKRIIAIDHMRRDGNCTRNIFAINQ